MILIENMDMLIGPYRNVRQGLNEAKINIGSYNVFRMTYYPRNSVERCFVIQQIGSGECLFGYTDEEV